MLEKFEPRHLHSLAIIIASSTVLACSPGVETNLAPMSTTPEAMVEKVMEWWPGDYNNDGQIESLREDGAPIWQQGKGEEHAFGGHLPVNAYYRKVDLPAFGDNVFYLEEFTFKEDTYRQRIYTIEGTDSAETLRVKLWYFKDKKSFWGAKDELTRLAKLTKEDMSPLPDNCDLYITPTSDGRLEMKMPKDQCKFGKSIFDYQVSLGANDFWFRDRIVDAETMQVKMTAGSFQYHKLDKLD